MKSAKEAAEQAEREADIKSLNETGFTVKEVQRRAAMKAQQADQDAMEADEQAEKEEKMKAVQAAMKAAVMNVEGYEIMKPRGSMVY